MRHIYTILLVAVLTMGCQTQAPVTPDQSDTTAVERVTARITEYPTVEVLFDLVLRELDIGPYRMVQSNDADCLPTYYNPFPTNLRGTSMTLNEQAEYFAGHIVLQNFGTFGEISSNGKTGCDVYWTFYDVMLAIDNGTGFFFMYLVDVQETNRFVAYGLGGYDVPVTWSADPCPLEIPCER